MLLFLGFYRVNYDDTNWKLLINDLRIPSKMQQISPTNKAQLIDDALNLARAGLLDYETSMNVTRYLSNELDYLPWKSAFTAFSYLDNMLIKTAGYDKFKVRYQVIVHTKQKKICCPITDSHYTSDRQIKTSWNISRKSREVL